MKRPHQYMNSLLNTVSRWKCGACIIAMLLLAAFTSQAQTQPPDTTQSKLRFADKISHWLVAYGMAGEDFLKQERLDFKSKAYAEVYIEAIIDHDAWMFSLLNRITKLKYDTKQTPHIIFDVKFTPVNKEVIDQYTVTIGMTATSQVDANITKIITDAVAKHIGKKTYADPNAAITDIEATLKECMTALGTKLGNTLAPNLMVRYQNEIFWNGHEIAVLESEGDIVELEAIDKTSTLIPGTELKWTNASPTRSRGAVDLTGIGSQQVKLKRTSTGDSLKVNVTRVNASEDINEMLKLIIVEVLSEKKQEALDTIVILKRDSTTNATSLANQIAILEDGNYPLEDIGASPQPLLSEPRNLSQLDEAEFNKSDDRKQGFSLLRSHKELHNRIRRKVNVVAFANLIVDQPEKVELLLDALLRNSGRLVARLILNRDSDVKRDAARNIVVDFLNRNLETIAGSNFGFQEMAPPLPPVKEVTVKPVTLSATNRFYINPKIQFYGKDTFVTNITNYLNSLSEPSYVVVNYSQDISATTYIERTQGTKPVGLPNGAKYFAITLVNIPGSTKVDFMTSFGIESDADQEQHAGDVLDELVKDFVEGDPVDAAILAWLQTLQSKHDQVFGFKYCKACSGSTSLKIEDYSANAKVFSGPYSKCIAYALLNNELKPAAHVEALGLGKLTLANGGTELLSLYFSDYSSVECTRYIDSQLSNWDFCASPVNENVVALFKEYIDNCIAGLAEKFANFKHSGNIEMNNPGTSLAALKTALSEILNNERYRNQKIAINVKDENNLNEALLPPSVTDIQQANMILDIAMKSGRLQLNVHVSNNYLKDRSGFLSNKIAEKDLWISEEELRLDVISNLLGGIAETQINGTGDPLKDVPKFLEVLYVTDLNLESIFTEGTLYKGMWHPDHGLNDLPTYAHWGSYLVGGSDAVVEEVTGIPLMAKTVFQLCYDEKMQQAYGQLLTWEGISQVAEGFVDDFNKTLNDPLKLEYSATKTTVSIAMIFFGGGFGGLGKAAEVTSKFKGCPKLTAMTKKLDNLGEAGEDAMAKLSKLAEDGVDPKKLEAIVERMNDLDAESAAKLVDDLSTNFILRTRMLDNPQLADAWKKFDDAELDDALRKNPDVLEKAGKLNCSL